MRPFEDDRVREVFASYSEEARGPLMRLRELVFEVADELDGVGRIEESLRWGEPAYLTHDPVTGTTLRLHSKGPAEFALYVNCQTSLIAAFRAQFGDLLDYEGTRAVRFTVGDTLPEDALRECIALTLTYKLRKRRGGSLR